MDSKSVLPVDGRTQRLERLLEISRTLSASLDLEPFLQSLISDAAELTGCESASILELDDSGNHLYFLALPQIQQDALKTVKVPLAASLAGWVFQNNQPLIVTDTAADPRHYKGADLAAGFVTRSLLSVPIVFHGETLGVFEAVNKTEHAHYTEEDLLILETIASLAAISLQNARLMNKARRSQDQMVQLDRMKSGFIAIASHELRTPLGLILGHATFLREVVSPESRPQMDIIVRNGLRLKEIIDDLAKMDNAQRGVATLRAHTLSIKRIAEEVTDSFYQEAKQKGLSLHCETPTDELLVEGDSSKIAIALSNIVENAISFTNPGGHILIVAESIPECVKISVVDDGIGIPPKDLPHIFERFYQVESHLTRKHNGMGLGLSVSKVMVEMHGGRIWVDSNEGKGSKFTFLLPVKSDQADTASKVFIS
jgi:signal transduction histidine kinase